MEPQHTIKVHCLRIHHEPETGEYELFDRYGKLVWDGQHMGFGSQTLRASFQIMGLPAVNKFGYCPIDSDDITLDFGKVVTLRLVNMSEGE